MDPVSSASIYVMTDNTGDAWDYEVVALIDDDFDNGRWILDIGYPYKTEQEAMDAGEDAAQQHRKALTLAAETITANAWS